MKVSGIYKIQSKIKPKCFYIGSAVWIGKRWNNHLFNLKNNKHPNRKLQNHFNKYGELGLQFSILLGCEREDLIKIEQYFIDSYHPWFNNRLIANSSLGLKASKRTKKKMRRSQQLRRINNPVLLETKLKIQEKAINRFHSEKTKLQLSFIKKIAIDQYDLNNNYVQSWDSALDVERNLSIYASNITKVLKGRYNSTGGFKWKYKNVA